MTVRSWHEAELHKAKLPSGKRTVANGRYWPILPVRNPECQGRFSLNFGQSLFI